MRSTDSWAGAGTVELSLERRRVEKRLSKKFVLDAARTRRHERSFSKRNASGYSSKS